MVGNPEKNALKDGLRRMRGAFVFVALFSALVNLLMLTGPLFMLQVYDRVLASRSVPTLVVLLAVVIGAFALLGLFDLMRHRILSRSAHALDSDVAPAAFRSWIVRSMAPGTPGYRPLNDLSTIRGFLCSPTVLALFDLPWFPFYIGVVFLLHVKLGLLAMAGAVVVILLALLNEAVTRRATADAAKGEIAENRFSDQTHGNAESVLAMGMVSNATRSWRGLRDRALSDMQRASERSETITATSKAFRLLLQSCILALGAYLAIGQEITPGTIVAASIIAGRALAPIDQTIGGWKMIKRARMARTRLGDYVKTEGARAANPVQLPPPQGNILLRNVTKFAPSGKTGEGRPILSDVSFDLKPGQGLGVIGPSASGKSTLARLLVGLWMPDRGSVRIDGATFDQWSPEQIGPHIGYLPQQVSLVPGTIGENIARFDPEASHEDIVTAARLARVHEMILGFPDGYETSTDSAISPLTGGQLQRIGLARAAFRSPALVVLDEPNSNLDAEGDAALAEMIHTLRAGGTTVVVMAHRPSAIAAVDTVMVLANGTVADFGEKTDVLRKATRVA